MTDHERTELVEKILHDYILPTLGCHGVFHWARVLENGRELATRNHAKVHVVELFALLHDSKRSNEERDKDHGFRAAEYAKTLRGRLFYLSDEDFALLYEACAYHTDGTITADVTVQTCWDADRLDLGRTGTTPSPERLCTADAKNPKIIALADEKSRNRYVPRLIATEWSLPSFLGRSENPFQVLYHGSVIQRIKTLEPLRKSHPLTDLSAPPAVYAAKDPAYSMAHAYKGPKRLGSSDFRCRMEILESGQTELDRTASLYIVASKDFTHLIGVDHPKEAGDRRSVVPVEVLGEIPYPSIKVGFEELGGVIVTTKEWLT